MNNKEFLDFTIECEKNIDVVQLKYCDMDLWPIIKCYLFNQFVKQSAASKKLKFWDRLIHVRNVLCDLKNLQNPLKKYDVAFLGNNASKSFFQERWYDYIQEPLIEQNEQNYKKCLFLESGLYLKTPKHRGSFPTRLFDELAFLMARIMCLFVKLKIPNDQFQKIAKKAFSAKGLKCYILTVYILSKIYSFILKRAAIKKVYITCYYSLCGLAMCYAAHKNHAIAIEVQHGNIYNNFAYMGFHKVPTDGYNTLPKEFLFWNDIDGNLYNENNSIAFIKLHSYNVIGAPWLAFWKSASPIIQTYRTQFREIKRNFNKSILVTLRPDIFGNNDWQKLIPIIEETADSILWLIRKHPTMSNPDDSLREICSLSGPNVDYQFASNTPLYALLGCVDLHLTTASNVAAEAMMFGVPTLFISTLAVDEMPHLTNANFNIVLTSTNEIRDYLIT